MKPVIGITSQFENLVNRRMANVNNTYIHAVGEGNGVPIILPILTKFDDIDTYLEIVDGIIFSGGADLSPLYFGEDPLKEVDTICEERDKMELELFKRAYEKGIPILGICRGLQVINTGLGGTLYQDIPKQLPDSIGHVCTHNVWQGYHNISIENESIMHDIFDKEKMAVNSLHHQSIKDLGRDLKISSTSIDGIIESIESTNDKFLLGVQFHPEGMIPGNRDFVKVFTYFVDICRK